MRTWFPAPWRLVRAALASTAISGAAIAPSAASYVPPLIYFPGKVIGEVSTADLNEIAGMAASRRNDDLIWVHNGGSIAAVHVLQQNGDLRASYTLETGIMGMDDAATGPGPVEDTPYLYFGDIGGNRSAIAVIRAPEPIIKSGTTPLTLLPNAERIELAYPDGAHTAEGLMVDPISGDLFVTTRESNRTRIYQATAASLTGGTPATLALAAEINFPLTSAAAISSDGSRIALRNDSAALMWRRSADQTVVEALTSIPTSVPMVGEPTEDKGRALSFLNESTAYFTTGEGKEKPIFIYRPNSSGFDSGQVAGEVEDDDLNELSGCAMSRRNPGVLWVHNDGDIDHLFAISSQGATLARLELGMNLVDCEDVAVGPGPAEGESYLYIGDIGDNDSNRDGISVLRMVEPVVDLAWAGNPQTIGPADFETVQLQYPSGAYDSEALMVDPITRVILVVTKEDGIARIFSAPVDATGSSTLSLVAQAAFSVASGGDISPDGTQIILRSEDVAALWSRSDGAPLAEVFGHVSREIPIIGRPKEPNGEAISFGADGEGYFTVSEKKNEPIFYFERLRADLLVNFSGQVQKGPDGISLPLQSVPGATVTVEFSDDLVDWSTLTTAELPEGTETVTDSEAHSMRFYRLRP